MVITTYFFVTIYYRIPITTPLFEHPSSQRRGKDTLIFFMTSPIKHFFIIFSLAVVLFIGITAALSVIERNNNDVPRQITLAGMTLDLHIAATESERQLGLSGFSALSADEAMLFIFDSSGHHGFWMKDMDFPIDIIWIDEKGVIVSIEVSVSPQTYPAVFTPSVPARYVLETVAGFSEKNNLKVDDLAEFID